MQKALNYSRTAAISARSHYEKLRERALHSKAEILESVVGTMMIAGFGLIGTDSTV